ncbi:MAG: hypothetical protein DMG64_12680 [Acidobacteria bacterium]|nr:MAG: hypothetical protein DMG64_12680 [Acidobacteriota bacterium]PYY21912.1 MAG: hypothetical protein DMG62_16040 [Acidobacteriota bacterium]
MTVFLIRYPVQLDDAAKAATGVEPASSDYDVTLIYTTGETLVRVSRSRALDRATTPARIQKQIPLSLTTYPCAAPTALTF